MRVSSAAKADSFRFQIALAIPESQLVAWYEQAAPGERVTYCHGYVPLRDDAAFKLAGALQRAGLVHLATEKDGTQTRWIAEKRGSATVSVAGIVPAKRSFGEDLAKIQLTALLDMLRAAAAAGARCPSITELAHKITGQHDQRARNRVIYLRKRLVTDGKITVDAGTHARAPVVTILARGKGCGCSTKGDDA